MPEQKTPDGEAGSAGLEGESLTRRERDVLALLAQGYSGPEIADKLTLATSSVKSHIQHLYGKLGVNSQHGRRGEVSARATSDRLGAQSALIYGARQTGHRPVSTKAT